MTNLVMGIDLGSTSLKAIAYDLDGNLVAQGSTPTKLTHPKENPEWAIWLPEDIWGGAADAIQQAVSQLDSPSQIKAVAVTGMGQDGLPVAEDGEWLYPFISWHDGRTAEQFDWWLKNITGEKTFLRAGLSAWPINAAMRLLWMQEHEPEILKKAHKWLLIEDFLNYQLCGEWATDYSMASCFALFDPTSNTWSEELINQSGIEHRLLPDAKPSGMPLGVVTAEAAARTGLEEGTPVILGGHDHLCGALPVGVFHEGTALNVSGTWEMILTPAQRPVLDSALYEIGMTVQPHVAQSPYTAEMTTGIWGGNPSAGMLEWFRTFARFTPEAKDVPLPEWDVLIDDAKETAVGAGGMLFLPHNSGASCPIVDGKSRGAFVGMTDRVGVPEFFRAIIEGLCYQYKGMLVGLEKCLDKTLDRCVTVGGVSRNHFWLQTKASILGRNVEVPAVEEATALGAAILAGLGVGLYENLETAYERTYREGKVIEPIAEDAKYYEKQFEVYQQLYPALQEINEQCGK